MHEEGDLTATTWHTLLDLRISPGGMNERGRIYLARDLTTISDLDRHHRGSNGEYEEADMHSEWVGLDRAVDRALPGDIQNGATVAGLLATAHARDNQWQSLCPADIPWIPQYLIGS